MHVATGAGWGTDAGSPERGGLIGSRESFGGGDGGDVSLEVSSPESVPGGILKDLRFGAFGARLRGGGVGWGAHRGAYSCAEGGGLSWSGLNGGWVETGDGRNGRLDWCVVARGGVP